MAIKNSGTKLKFSEIEDEFGQNPQRSLGSYQTTHPDFGNKNLGELTNLPLDTGIPTSGQIKFSDFYSKRLNVVVDLHSSGNATFNHNAYTNRFANNNYNIVGNYRSSVTKSTWQGGKKIIIHINQQFGSENATNTNDFALEMGDISDTVTNAWPTATIFAIDVGSSGLVGGKGGNGGDRGNEETSGEDGGNGTSGMKIHSGFQDEITGESRIFGGGGGGGSGSGAEQNDWGDRNSARGGGGGGGAGLPFGEGGNEGGAGEDGTATSGGEGENGTYDAEAEGGDGGDGGAPGQPGGNATGGKSIEGSNGNGGSAGNQYVFY
tara:strand:- start:3116 stop:4078 length:963 start_codon:yes stop_codon:yes gene_type:complete